MSYSGNGDGLLRKRHIATSPGHPAAHIGRAPGPVLIGNGIDLPFDDPVSLVSAKGRSTRLLGIANELYARAAGESDCRACYEGQGDKHAKHDVLPKEEEPSIAQPLLTGFTRLRKCSAAGRMWLPVSFCGLEGHPGQPPLADRIM